MVAERRRRIPSTNGRTAVMRASGPRIKTQLKPLHVNMTVSLRLLQTHRSSCPLHQTWIKPPLLLLQKMVRICSAVKRLYDRTKKSWTSSGSIRSRGTTSKIFEVHVRSTSAVRVCAAASAACHSPCHHASQYLLLASEPAWKALVLSSEARLDLFWAEDWPALWAGACSV